MGRRSKPSTRKYRAGAFFDVDGTLVQGFLMLDFADYLLSQREFDRRMLHAIEYIDTEYRRRKTPEDLQEELKKYDRYAEQFLLRFGEGIRGKKQTDLENAAREFIGEAERFPFTKPLIRIVRENGYLPIIISGGPSMVIDAFAERLGIGSHCVFSTEYEVTEDGIYTGRVLTLRASYEGKRDTVVKAAQKHKLELDQSLGFGDALFDLGIFEQTQYNFVIRPSGVLREIAEEKGYVICEEVETVVPIVEKRLKILTK